MPAEFGTNTGRQGIFDPRNRLDADNARRRLQQLENEYPGDLLQIGR
jgi:hypothetical protein